MSVTSYCSLQGRLTLKTGTEIFRLEGVNDMRKDMNSKELIKSTLMSLLERYNGDDITVKMVCLEGNFSKPTLYNHYSCLMGALDDAYQSDFRKALINSDTYENWVEGFYNTLEFLKERRKIMIHLYRSSRREDLMNMIRRHGEALVLQGITECAEDKGFVVSEKDKAFMLDFYMSVFMGIVDKFIREGLVDDPRYIADMCNIMMHHHIRNTLRKLQTVYGKENETGQDTGLKETTQKS